MYESSDLIASANIFLFAIQMNTLGDIGGLLLQSHQHIAGLIVKACKTPELGLSEMLHHINKVVIRAPNLLCVNKICL